MPPSARALPVDLRVRVRDSRRADESVWCTIGRCCDEDRAVPECEVVPRQDENATPRVLKFYPNFHAAPGLWYADEQGRTRLWDGWGIVPRVLDTRVSDWIEDWEEHGIRTQWIEQGHQLLAELRTIVEPFGHTVIPRFETPQPGQVRGPDHEPTVLNFYPDDSAAPALWFDIPGGDCLWCTDALPDGLEDEIAAWIRTWLYFEPSQRTPYPAEWLAEGYRLADELQRALAPLGHTVNATFDRA